MVVAFCGHKNVYETELVSQQVKQIILGLVKEGADTFLLGGYGSFDSIAAITVRELKKDYPGLRSILVLPYLNRGYDASLYDESVYPPIEDVPKKFAISRRNEWMVEKADVIIAYVDHDWGGAAATTLRYAERKKKRIINVVQDNPRGDITQTKEG